MRLWPLCLHCHAPQGRRRFTLRSIASRKPREGVFPRSPVQQDSPAARACLILLCDGWTSLSSLSAMAGRGAHIVIRLVAQNTELPLDVGLHTPLGILKEQLAVSTGIPVSSAPSQ